MIETRPSHYSRDGSREGRKEWLRPCLRKHHDFGNAFIEWPKHRDQDKELVDLNMQHGLMQRENPHKEE
jgi:hypothetical protein